MTEPEPRVPHYWRSLLFLAFAVVLWAPVFYVLSTNPANPSPNVLTEYYGVLSLGTALGFAAIIDFVLDRHYKALDHNLKRMEDALSLKIQGVSNDIKELQKQQQSKKPREE